MPFVMNLFFRCLVHQHSSTSNKARSSGCLHIWVWTGPACGQSTSPRLAILSFLPQIPPAILGERYPLAGRQKWRGSCSLRLSGSARNRCDGNIDPENRNRTPATAALSAGTRWSLPGTGGWSWCAASDFLARKHARARPGHRSTCPAAPCRPTSRLLWRSRRFAGMVEWWGRSPPTNVARVRFPDPASYVGWVCCCFSSLLRGFFSGFSGFPLSSKIIFSKF